MDLALFDFDGTITGPPTYIGFLRAATSPARKAAASVALAPLLAGYRLGLVDQPTLRPYLALAAFRGQSAARIRELGEQYSRKVLPLLVRPVARERLVWHQNRGDRVVVVSASLEAYLGPWCRAWSVDLICTTLVERDGWLTGRYDGGDCTGAEKARRVRERYRLEDYGRVYAYGDSPEDREMLALAHHRTYCWHEIGDTDTPWTAPAVAGAQR
jgi:HAD superfamily hydrolase (TIGR01490 family)